MSRHFFDKLRIARGRKNNITTLDVGEQAFATDTGELLIGTVDGNKKIAQIIEEHDVVVTYARRKITSEREE